MNIKKIIAKKAIETVVTKTGAVDAVVSALVQKSEMASGIKKKDEYLKKLRERHYLIIQARAFSLNTMQKVLIENADIPGEKLGRYRVYDGVGRLRYEAGAKVSSGIIIDRDIIGIRDEAGNEIGIVREKLLSIGVPLLEKNVKSCFVEMGNETICSIKKAESFGDLTFDVDGKVGIKIKEKKEIIVKYRGRQIAHLYKLPTDLRDGYADKYVLGYNEESAESLAVVLTIAVDSIL